MKSRTVTVFEWGPIQVIARLLGVASLTTRAIQEYVSWWTDLRKDRGATSAVKALKDLNSRCKLVVIGAPAPRKPYGGQWIKLNHVGLPKRLVALTAL